VEDVEQFGAKISKRRAGLEKLDDSGDINRFWEYFSPNIKISVIQLVG
jgi:hypothetical protein